MSSPFTSIWKKPDNWTLIPIEKVTSNWRGGAPFEPDDFTEKGFPVLHKGAVQRYGKILIDDKKKLSRLKTTPMHTADQ